MAPALTLLFLSPVIVELLFGSTHLTIIAALVPEIGFYGGAAVIIRYVVRRLHRGWVSILLLGIAFAIFEEFLVVQTSISPELFVGLTSPFYGRLFGVNWVYLLWAVGYESVWGIVLPIYLTELIFPNRREDPWLGRRGLSAIIIIFALGSISSWAIWTQVVVPAAIGSIYDPPLSLVIFASVMIAILGAIALKLPSIHHAQKAAKTTPQPWQVGSLVFVLSLLWFVLVAFAFGTFPTVPATIAVLAGLVLATATLLVTKRLSASMNWRDDHRLAMIIGGLGGSMLAGFWASGIVLAVDFVGKIILNAITVVLLLYLARALHGRGHGVNPAPLAARDSVLLGSLKPKNVEEGST
jgi:hypothetical protein